MESFLHYCIRVILNESMNILSIETIKCLSLVSREISTTIKPFIERDYCFVLYHDRRLTHYSPQNLKGVQNANQITPSTKKLKTYDFFIEPIDLSHFTHITHLEFGIHFNTPIDSLLPPNITHLTLGHYFNKPVDHLPQSITHLTFGPYFEQPLIPFHPTQSSFNSYFMITTIHWNIIIQSVTSIQTSYSNLWIFTLKKQHPTNTNQIDWEITNKIWKQQSETDSLKRVCN